MDTHMRDALVEGYEPRIGSLSLPDADDRHVLAAAIHCGATAIVTANLRHFPATKLADFAIEAIHPDAFIVGLLDNGQGAVLAALRRLRSSFKAPPKTATDLLTTMRRQGLTASADAFRAVADKI